MSKYTLAILLILISSWLCAESRGIITGMVMDSRNKEPLVGANIVILETELGASTDENGNFYIENVPVGTYRLEFSFIGYKTAFLTDIVVKQSRPTKLEFELLQNAIEGKGITVSAGYFVEDNNTQTSVTGLSREEIRRFPGGFEDVVRTVSTLPGVAVVNAGGRNDLLVRGGGPSENLYTLNNVEVPNINHFSTQGTGSGSLSFVNLDFIENVTFSTGGFGAVYGDKMSSVLSLSLTNGRSDKIGGKFLVSATQFGLNLEGPISNKGNFIISARKSYLDLIFKLNDLPFIPVYTDFNVVANYNLSQKDKLFFIGLAAIDNIDRNQSSLENRVKNASILDNNQQLYVAGLNYRRLLNHGFFDVILSGNFFQYQLNQSDAFEEEYFKSKADEKEINLKATHYWSITNSLGFNAGLSSKVVYNDNTTVLADTIYDRNGRRIHFSEIGVNQINKINASGNKYAAFIEFDWLVTPTLDINFGLRSDYFNFLDSPLYVAPRLSLKYRLSSHHSFKISSGIYYQSPSYVWVVNPVNRNLKALRNQMIILGWNYLIQNDLRLSVEGYYKRYSDIPTGTIPGVTDYIVQTNTGTGFGGREDDFQSFGYFDMASGSDGLAYGAELLLQKKFSEIPCYGQVSISYGKNKFTAGNGISYPGTYDQRFIFNLSGGYIFNSRWEISTKFRYFTGLPYTPVYRPSENPTNPGFIQNLPEEYLSARLDAGHHLDVRVERYFYWRNWTIILFLDIQNIYNNKIPLRPRYDFWDDDVVTSSEIAVLPTIGISWEF
jgi:hypothetical protein